ncbi:hypothetical protein THIOSC13_810010 [uncultured Thiomicrorhabdus sp.]
MITHLDLFSGIVALAAADWVWGKENVNHIFCEIEEFPQKVLRKHWPESEIHNDITNSTEQQLTMFISSQEDSHANLFRCRETKRRRR